MSAHDDRVNGQRRQHDQERTERRPFKGTADHDHRRQ
jgi:hypothetical protein